MSATLTDSFIEELLKEKKSLPKDYLKKLKTRKKSGSSHEQKELEIIGSKGHKFVISIRKNKIDITDFSIILRYKDDSGISYNILRYNGKHPHTNHIEKVKINGYHIHKATQRYQENGFRIESYAEITTKYSSYQDALSAFLADLNFKQANGSTSLHEFGGK